MRKSRELTEQIYNTSLKVTFCVQFLKQYLHMNWKKRILDHIWLIVYPTEERGVVRREILRVLILKQDFWLANKWQSFAIFSNLKKEMTSTTYLPILYIIHVCNTRLWSVHKKFQRFYIQ